MGLPSMKALFLDIDGVLNSQTWTEANYARGGNLLDLDPEAVRRVLNVLAATDAKLVLSSTWRLSRTLVKQLLDVGLPIFDSTPRADAFDCRSDEITAWLKSHPDVTTFAIVDDDPDAGYGELAPYFVQTNCAFGLTDEPANALIAILNRDRELESWGQRFAAGMASQE